MMVFLEIYDICERADILKVIFFAKQLIKIVYYLVPAFLILMITVDLLKSVISGSEDDMRKNANMAIKRIVSTLVFFLVPTIVSLVLNVGTDATSDVNKSFTSCYSNATLRNIKKYEAIEKLKAAVEALNLVNTPAYVSHIGSRKKVIRVASKEKAAGVTLGQRYSLTEEELNKIAHICYREQRSVEGAGFEASIMANLYELRGQDYSSIVDYLIHSGWFGDNVEADMVNPEYAPKDVFPDVLNAVRDVLVNGRRTLPLYIDEHDCIYCGETYGFDIIQLAVNGAIYTSGKDLLDHSHYIKDVTKIRNKYGSNYTFYTWAPNGGDPFGYTDAAYQKVKNSE